MAKLDISELFLYRRRYFIGYSLVIVGLILALVFAGLYLPGGISNQEMQSVIKSASITIADFWSADAVNLPYNILQHASLAVFGVSIIGIKLPSIILAFLSAIGLVFLLKQWFKPSIAVLASLIALTTGQFLFISQNGTPDVLYLFWPVWLILIASLIPVRQNLRKFFIIAFFAMAALSLYTPLSVYVLIVIAGAVVLHPHLRYLIKQLSKTELIAGALIVLLLVSPLISAVLRAPSLGLELLGVPAKWPNLLTNLASLGSQYFGFAEPGGTTIITPFFELGSMLIIALGAYFIFKTRVTAKSYVVTLWTLCLVPVIILNPNFTTITFLPLVLLLASGLNGLLSYWYGLFPHNPYARIGGLVPLVILVVVLVSSGVNRYIYSYQFDPNISPNFSRDLRLIPSDTKNIVVTNKELPFYNVMAEYNDKLNISTTPNSASFLVTHDAKYPFLGYKIDKIITTSFKNDADRFYLYKKITE